MRVVRTVCYRARHGLQQTGIGRLGEAGTAMQPHVLTDAVEDDHRVVDGVPQHGEDRGDEGAVELDPEDGHAAHDEEDVMDERDDGRDGEAELVADGDVQHDEDAAHDEGPQGLGAELGTDDRSHAFAAQVGDLAHVGKGLLERGAEFDIAPGGLFVIVHRRCAQVQIAELALLIGHDLDVAAAQVLAGEHAANLGDDRRGLGVALGKRGGELIAVEAAAGEVDPVVEVPDPPCHETEQDGQAGDGVPQLGLADDVPVSVSE